MLTAAETAKSLIHKSSIQIRPPVPKVRWA